MPPIAGSTTLARVVSPHGDEGGQRVRDCRTVVVLRDLGLDHGDPAAAYLRGSRQRARLARVGLRSATVTSTVPGVASSPWVLPTASPIAASAMVAITTPCTVPWWLRWSAAASVTGERPRPRGRRQPCRVRESRRRQSCLRSCPRRATVKQPVKHPVAAEPLPRAAGVGPYDPHQRKVRPGAEEEVHRHEPAPVVSRPWRHLGEPLDSPVQRRT